MEIAKLVLQYLQAILSWPVIIGGLSLYFIGIFRVEIGLFLNRLIKGQAFGVSIEASNPSEQRKELTESTIQQSETVKQIAQEAQTNHLIDSLSDRAKFVLEEVQRDPEKATRELSEIYNAYHFERAYNLIYGTQISLLEHLASLGDKGDQYINLAKFYWQFLEKRGTSPSEYQFADYVRFLSDLNFIEISENGNNIPVRITPYGVNFLSYIKTQYQHSYKYRIF